MYKGHEFSKKLFWNMNLTSELLLPVVESWPHNSNDLMPGCGTHLLQTDVVGELETFIFRPRRVGSEVLHQPCPLITQRLFLKSDPSCSCICSCDSCQTICWTTSSCKDSYKCLMTSSNCKRGSKKQSSYVSIVVNRHESLQE